MNSFVLKYIVFYRKSYIDSNKLPLKLVAAQKLHISIKSYSTILDSTQAYTIFNGRRKHTQRTRRAERHLSTCPSEVTRPPTYRQSLMGRAVLMVRLAVSKHFQILISALFKSFSKISYEQSVAVTAYFQFLKWVETRLSMDFNSW